MRIHSAYECWAARQDWQIASFFALPEACVRTKIAVTIAALVAIIVHFAFPQLEFDFATVVLLVVAVAPLLAPIIKSLELPGGFRIELHDIQRATEKIQAVPAPTATRGDLQPGTAETSSPSSETLSPVEGGLEQRLADLASLAQSDPNVALVALRIEIERMLRNIVRGHNLKSERKSAGQLLRVLQDAGILQPDLAVPLHDLIQYGNRAAHGAVVSRDAAQWAIATAPAILGSLTDYLGS